MLINPDRMKLVYRGVKFDLFELERGCEKGIDSRVLFFSPICAGCLFMHGLTKEERQPIENREEVAVSCGVEECENQADFLVSFDFGFEEGGIEEEIESAYGGWGDLYDEAELIFD